MSMCFQMVATNKMCHVNAINTIQVKGLPCILFAFYISGLYMEERNQKVQYSTAETEESVTDFGENVREADSVAVEESDDMMFNRM